MRAALETIAKIEQYLLGELSEVETKVFETRMDLNPEFKNEVELQAQLMHSLNRIALQQTIQNAQKTYQFWKLIKLIAAITVPIFMALLTWYLVNISQNTKTSTEAHPTKVEQKLPKDATPNTIKERETDEEIDVENPPTTTVVYGENVDKNPLENIPTEVFTISTEKDTIVETANGIVILVPKDAFVNANNELVSENVKVSIKEALDAETIMNAGLSTLYNDKLLETGGMFFIEARKDGALLQIHPEKAITVDIPTENRKATMQLFDGVVSEDGSILWTNPKPLNKTLIPQDILSLNFYPPKYLEALAEKGYDTQNKKFTDSLYYSFQHETRRTIIVDTLVGRVKEVIRGESTVDALDVGVPRDTVWKRKSISQEKTETTILGLNPLKIKAIWNENYQNTFLATKAFEKRLQLLHQSCGSMNHFLDMYVEHLDWNLSRVDSIVADYIPAEFRQDFINFSKEGLTNVANLDVNIKKLNAYYEQQQKVYRMALAQTQKSVDSLLNYDTKYKELTAQQQKNHYLIELAVTVDKVSKKLGVSLPRAINRMQQNQSSTDEDLISMQQFIENERQKQRYRASIQTTGWKNIDRIIEDQAITSLKNRTTTTIQNNEKKATISFTDYEVSIKNSHTFEQLFVYVVPKEFNSYIRLQSETNRFNYRLNDLLNYDVYCIAYQNKRPFFFRKEIQKTTDHITLVATTTEKLQQTLSQLDSGKNALQTEINYQNFRLQNDQKLKSYRELRILKRELKPIVFPCKRPATLTSLNVLFRDVAPVDSIIIDNGEN
jgi:hypothetical protein